MWEKYSKGWERERKKKKKAQQRNPSTYSRPKIKLLVVTHHPVWSFQGNARRVLWITEREAGLCCWFIYVLSYLHGYAPMISVAETHAGGRLHFVRGRPWGLIALSIRTHLQILMNNVWERGRGGKKWKRVMYMCARSAAALTELGESYRVYRVMGGFISIYIYIIKIRTIIIITVIKFKF